MTFYLPMRILLVKTSSLGDVIHNLPVVADIHCHFPEAIVDWCVEDSFSAIPRLHPGVSQIIPVAMRRWRKGLLKAETRQEIAAALHLLRSNHYDAVIDTQGLVKSAVIGSLAHGAMSGYAANSAREPLAALFCRHNFSIDRQQHAVLRNRQLVGAALNFPVDDQPDYGIAAMPAAFEWLPAKPYVVFLTATSRDDKLWPEARWLALGASLYERGINAVLPGGSQIERERAARLAAGIPGSVAAPAMSIPELAALLAGSCAAVGVDTGLTHLAVALKVPTVALYTATDPGLTGVLGTGFYRNLGGKAQIPEVLQVLAELLVGLA